MRGKAFYLQFQGKTAGITPAYAGKREERTQGILKAQDHPRLCGEKHPSHYTGGSIECRITPAYAGKRDMPELRSVWL